MRHQKVRDIMTADPVTVTSATSLKYVAELLVNKKVSVVPVLTLQGKLLGIVSETDLIRKEELQREPDSWHLLHLNYRARRDLATAETAGEIMREPVATVHPDVTLAEAARLMDRHEVSCLPVVDESGQLLGVVSSQDLLRVFLRPDEDIRAQVVTDVLVSYLDTNPALVHVEVSDGVVRLAGELDRKSMLNRIWPAVRAVEGVIAADGDLGYAFDDTEPLPAPERDESPLTRGTHPPIAARRLT